MDSYEQNRVYYAPQNLQMDDERVPNMTKDDVIRAFKLFVREHQVGNTYIYRYIKFILENNFKLTYSKNNTL